MISLLQKIENPTKTSSKIEVENDTKNEQLKVITKVQGHKLDVNCVTFNPVYGDIFASCSDDRTIKLWAITQ